MEPRTAHRPTRWLLLIALGGLVSASSTAVVLFRPAHAGAADGPHVAILESNRNDAKSFKYDPSDLTVKPGTTVVWDWKGTDKHSVTADDGSFDSGVKTGMGLRWEHKFDAPGDYLYSCTPHSTMTGVVHVR